MLEPGARQLLFEALRPPTGYEFDQGLGTTFTLDLLALLVAPIAFTAFERVEDGSPSADSLGWLESLRRHSNRLTMFCHGGYVAVPRAKYPQLAFLEESIVECVPQAGGTFHPKVWVLRYVGDGPVKYRVLNLSRNLSFSRAWDTMLSLDGELSSKRQAANANAGLLEFVRALPGVAARSASAGVMQRVSMLGDELAQTAFTLPEGFETLRFWPLGLGGRRVDPFKNKGGRLLIVSPFITAGAVESLAADTTECLLVSTPSQLASLAHRPAGVTDFKVLSDRAIAEAEADEGDTAAPRPATVAEAIQQAHLHAKLYVSDNGRDAHVWTGSANATQAGLGLNVEMLVELTGPKRLFGIDTLMKTEPGQLRFANLLTAAGEFVATSPESDEERELERAFDAARSAIAVACVTSRVAAGRDDTYDVSLEAGVSGAIAVPPGIRLFVRPITLTALTEVDPAAATLATFESLTFDALTGFVEVDLLGRIGAEDRHCRFVITAPLVGAPTDRRDRILRSMLSDRKKVFRFLMLLLADEGVDPLAGTEAGTQVDGSPDAGPNAFVPTGLLEMLLSALDHAPSRLDHVESLLKQLPGDTVESLLPEGFEAVWAPIWQQRLRTREVRP